MRKILLWLLAIGSVVPVYCQQVPEPKQTAPAPIIHWGKVSAGVRVGLALDRLNYRAGEDIPLRIFIEDHSATVPVYTEPPIPRSGFRSFKIITIRVAVLDQGGPIRPLQKDLPLGGGPLSCPASLPKQTPVETQTQLSTFGLVPTEEGRYKVVVSWSPYTSHGWECVASLTRPNPVPPPASLSRPFITVTSAPIYINVTGNSSSNSRMEMHSNYEAWKSKFKLVDTSFGEKTALQDKSTGLEWLRLNFTANHSYENVLQELRPGGEFDGWRLATVPELRRLFADFTGTPTGHSSDQQIGRKLQRLLGGPLFEITNRETGWHRIDTRAWVDKPMGLDNHMIHYHHGYIGEDAGPLVTIDPDSAGSSVPNFASADTGTFLVRQRHRSFFDKLFKRY